MEATMYDLFSTAAHRTPTATVAANGANVLTYAALDEQVCQLSRALLAAGVASGESVMLWGDDGLDQLRGLLAVVRIGAVALPLSPAHGARRVRYALRTSKARVVVRRAATPLTFAGVTVLLDDALTSPAADTPPAPPAASMAITFVSHDTGQAEGVPLSHNALRGAASFISQRLGLDLSATVCAGDWASDAGLAVVAGTLACGGVIHFANANPATLTAELAIAAPICLALPLHALLDAANDPSFSFQTVRHIVSWGSDTGPCEAMKQALRASGITWHNIYGFPAFQMVTTLKAAGERDTSIHVGKPAPGVRALVLDATMQIAGVGVPGELYVAGASVFDGYLHNAPLDAARFVPNPFGAGRLYRAGCVARRVEGDRIEIIARSDGAVAGFSSHTTFAEIEAALLEYPAIDDAAVAQRAPTNGRPSLTAFLVSAAELAALHVQSHLVAALGASVGDVGIVQLDRLPRDASGQLDRPALVASHVLDTAQLEELEQSLQVALNSQELAVVTHIQPDTVLPLHIDDVLPPAAPQARWPSAATAVHTTQTTTDRPLAQVVGAPLRDAEHAPPTLVAALLRTIAAVPDHGVTYIGPDGSGHHQPYAAVLEDAERIVGGLRAAGVGRGAHILFQLDHNIDFVGTFWACMLGGFVPVPLSIPTAYDPNNGVVAKLHNAWRSLDRPVLLTSQHLAKPIAAAFAALGGGELALLTVDALRRSEPDKQHNPSQPTDPAVLLLTSGSTGVPKGVVLSHSNIIARSLGTAQLNHFTSADISFNWMPLDHVGGVVMFHLRDVILGARQIHARTDDMLQDPIRWLDLMETYGVTNTWAPNFAFALINDLHERVNSRQRNLAALRFILNAGEAVQAKTAQAFLRLLRPHALPPTAMHPAYGMSETSSAITYSQAFSLDAPTGIHELDQASLKGVVRPADVTSIAVSFVEVGGPIADTGLRIVDRQNQVLPEGVIGRLQVRGPTVLAGYHNNPAANGEAFTDDGWFTTGDLAFLSGGQLTITGREKDVIIVNGVNYHSHEIEAVVEALDDIEVSYTAACALRSAGRATEEVVVFFCSKHEDFPRQAAQIAPIRQAVVQKIGLNPTYILPVRKEDIPKTAIGKIQRTQLSQQFSDGHFAALTRRIDVHTANERTMPDWFFTRVWRPAQAPVGGLLAAEYCIVGPPTPLRAALHADLERAGSRCAVAEPATTFARHSATCYSFDPADPAHCGQLLAALAADGFAARNIVYLCDDIAITPVHLDDMRAAQRRGVFSVLALIQALAKHGATPATLLVTTRYSEAADDQAAVAYAAAPLRGLLGAAPLELPWLTCRQIDLADDAALDASANIVQELRRPGGSGAVAYRAGRRLVPRFTRAAIDNRAASDPLVSGGLYLIIGGLGGIGAHTARWLAARYGARLLLVGSTPLPPHHHSDERVVRRQRTYEELLVDGVECSYAAVDICDPNQLRAAIADAEARWNTTLAGAFHFAGVGSLRDHWNTMHERSLVGESPASIEAMLAPKLYGAWALHQALANRPDTLVVLASSMSSLIANPTFGAYAAANSGLDSLAHARRAAGYTRTVCINWSQWQNIGMSEDSPPALQAATSNNGLQQIAPAHGVQALLAAITGNHAQLAVGLDGANRLLRRLRDDSDPCQTALHLYYGAEVAADLEALGAALRQRHSDQPLACFQIAQLPRTPDGRINRDQLQHLAQPIATSAALAAPTTAIERQLVAIWQEVLGRPTIGIYDNFFELGGHSLLATQLVSRLRSELQVEVRLHQLFETPTVAGLAALIAQAQPSDTVVDALFAELGDLSPDEMALLLA